MWQVQGVAYLHQWNDTVSRRGGFYFYANGIAPTLSRDCFLPLLVPPSCPLHLQPIIY